MTLINAKTGNPIKVSRTINGQTEMITGKWIIPDVLNPDISNQFIPDIVESAFQVLGVVERNDEMVVVMENLALKADGTCCKDSQAWTRIQDTRDGNIQYFTLSIVGNSNKVLTAIGGYINDINTGLRIQDKRTTVSTNKTIGKLYI